MVAPNDNVPSQRRVEANRRNAQKSTGPRTEAGKAISSMNAVKHGLAAQASLLPGEDPAELNRLAESMQALLEPADPMQQVLVERVVALTWKLRRVAAAEEAEGWRMDPVKMQEWDDKLERKRANPVFATVNIGPRPTPRDPGTLLADCFREVGQDDDPVDGRLVRITAYELKIEASLRATMRELRMVRKDCGALAREREREGAKPQAATQAQLPESAAVPEPRAEACAIESRSPADAGARQDLPEPANSDAPEVVYAEGQNEPVAPRPAAPERATEPSGP